MTSRLFKIIDCDSGCKDVCNLKISYNKDEIKSIIENIKGLENLSNQEINQHLVELLIRSIHLNLGPDHQYWAKGKSDD